MEPISVKQGPPKLLIQEGLCRDADPGIFFPELGEGVEAAKLVCERCPVQRQCLEYALEAKEGWGVWGAKSTSERKHISKKRQRRSHQ